ncbi:hypothetical protein EBQ93_01915 [bacterium]|nr:hypothetical protein [bacterium]
MNMLLAFFKLFIGAAVLSQNGKDQQPCHELERNCISVVSVVGQKPELTKEYGMRTDYTDPLLRQDDVMSPWGSTSESGLYEDETVAEWLKREQSRTV